QVGHCIASVMIGDGDAVQTFGFRRGDQIFRTRNAVAGEKGVAMQIEIECHFRQVSLAGIKWKASDSRNGQLYAKRSGAGCNQSFCARAALLRGVRDSVSGIVNFSSSQHIFMSTLKECARSISAFPSRTKGRSTSNILHESKKPASSHPGRWPKRLNRSTF